LGEKLKSLMAARRDAGGRSYSSRTLSAAVKALPGDHASVSYATVNNLANGNQDNPTVLTVMALCKALGDVPPAHLLPHDAYGDLAALQAFEDPRARHILALLDGMPDSTWAEVLADLEHRRADLGLEAVQSQDGTPRNDDAHQRPEAAPKRGRRRRRSSQEAAEYAADSLEGL
jgi:hypothetical protein